MAKKTAPSEKPAEMTEGRDGCEPVAAPPVPTPPPCPPPPPPMPPPFVALRGGAEGSPIEDYVAFRKLVAAQVMEILSIVGHVVVTAVAVCLFFKWIPHWSYPWPWTGLCVLVLGNLVWRVICEVVIVLYQIHDRLASIDEKIKRG